MSVLRHGAAVTCHRLGREGGLPGSLLWGFALRRPLLLLLLPLRTIPLFLLLTLPLLFGGFLLGLVGGLGGGFWDRGLWGDAHMDEVR